MSHVSKPLLRLLPGFLILAGLLLGGCSSHPKEGDPGYAEWKAKRITDLRKEAMETIRQWNSAAKTRAIESQAEADQVVDGLIEASEKLLEATELDPFASRPRFEYADCLSAIGMVFMSQYVAAGDSMAEYEGRGQTPPADLQTRRQDNLQKSEKWLRDSCREFEFYATHIMPTFPNQDVYYSLHDNYVFLGDWEKAISALQRLNQNFTLQPAAKARVEHAIRKYEEHMADLELQAEENAAKTGG